MIGYNYSTSQSACMIRFSGGSPYDGRQGLYDSDHAGLTICVTKDGVQYDYNRADAQHFRLSRVWVDSKPVEIWEK